MLFAVPTCSLAQIKNDGMTSRLERAGESAGFSQATETSVSETLNKVLSMALSFLGVIFIILIVIGGFQWMMAGGNEEQVKKATGRIKNAVIGLIVVASAYAIWMMIDNYFLKTAMLN